jgi:hypothetical protein
VGRVARGVHGRAGRGASNRRIESYVSPAMAHGIATESEARTAYEFLTDNTVELVGFVDHPTIAMAGASPDGLIGNYGLIEIKSPMTHTHIASLLGLGVDDKYKKQVQWQLAVCEREWCDWCSYDPGYLRRCNC